MTPRSPATAKPDARRAKDSFTLLAELAPVLAELEAVRAKAHARGLRVVAGVTVFVAVAGMAALTGVIGPGSTFSPMLIVLASLLVGPLIWGLAMGGADESYRRTFKARVIGHLVARRYPGAKYRPSAGISVTEFRASRLFRPGIDRYKSEDLIEGRLGATHMRISDVHAEYKTTTNKSTTWHTIFRGQFCVADFNKHFQGATYVLPDGSGIGLGLLGRWLEGVGMTHDDTRPVALEDVDFERLYSAYGTDQVEARYILSTSLMRRLVDFRQRMRAKVYLAFVQDHVIVAIESYLDHFEPRSIWTTQPALTAQDVDVYLAQIELAESIVDGLNLNTRIWGKP